MSAPSPLDIFDALHGLLHLFRQHMLARLHRHQPGLGFLEMRVLMMVGEQAGISQKALVERSYLDKAQLTRLLSGLEQQGWLQRQASAQDKRVRHLFLSTAGEALYQQLRQDHAEVAGQLFGNWPADTAQALIAAAAAQR